MSPDIGTLTPPRSYLSSLAKPLRGHQLWRGIDGTRARVLTPSNEMYWENSTCRKNVSSAAGFLFHHRWGWSWSLNWASCSFLPVKPRASAGGAGATCTYSTAQY